MKATRLCSFPDCVKPMRANSLCVGHNEQQKRGYELRPLLRRAPRGQDPVARLSDAITIAESGCWEWNKHRGPGGYGRVNVDGRPQAAHRWAYELLVAAIPEGLEVDHLCRVTCCVNPDHLEPVTGAENLRRSTIREAQMAYFAAKTHCPNGHPYTPENVGTQRSRGRTYKACRTCRNARYRAYRARRRAAHLLTVEPDPTQETP